MSPPKRNQPRCPRSTGGRKEEEDAKYHQTDRHWLYLSVVASLGYLTVGLLRGWPATAILSLQDHQPAILVTEDDESWVSSVPLLAGFFGCLAAGPLMDRFGRKKTLLVSGPLFAAGWILTGISPNLSWLLVARVLSGLSAGLIIPAAQIYVSECSHAEVRGALSSVPALLMTVGVMLSYVVGIWLDWRQISLVSAAPPVALFILLFRLPESPAWLASKGDSAGADASMKWLEEGYVAGGAPYDGNRRPMAVSRRRLSCTDMANMSARKSSVNIEALSVNFTIVDKPARHLNRAKDPNSIFRSGVYRPFLLCCALLVLQALSGFDVVISYTVEIFEAADSSIEGHLATVTVGVVQVAATATTLLLIDKLGRKPLLVSSAVLQAVSMAALSVYMYHERRGEAVGLGAVPLAALIVFTLGYSIGLGSVPFVLMGEVLPSMRRSGLSAVALAATLAAMFVVIKTYDGVRDWIHNEGVFALYAGSAIVTSLFVCALVPETKGRTLEEIESYFKQSSNTGQFSDPENHGNHGTPPPVYDRY